MATVVVILCQKRIGQANEVEAEKISSIGILFALVIGILIALISWIFISPLASFIGGSASESLMGFTVDYLR